MEGFNLVYIPRKVIGVEIFYKFILQVFYEDWDAAMVNMKIEGQREGSLSSSELEGRNYLTYLT